MNTRLRIQQLLVKVQSMEEGQRLKEEKQDGKAEDMSFFWKKKEEQEFFWEWQPLAHDQMEIYTFEDVCHDPSVSHGL